MILDKNVCIGYNINTEETLLMKTGSVLFKIINPTEKVEIIGYNRN